MPVAGNADYLQIERLEAVSPSLAELLRGCKLRAALSRLPRAGEYVLGNPKAWLGKAYHEVLQAAGACLESEAATVVRQTWDAAIAREYQRSRAHDLDQRFGPPESWPGYHLVCAMAKVRAAELIARASGQRNGCAVEPAAPAILREARLSGAGGKLVGRPDMVRAPEVVDFKTGDVHEDENPEQIKSAYVRQLRLYAFLVRETQGWWPQRGILLPMTGSPVVVDLVPNECEREAREAVQLLDDYNRLLDEKPAPERLANPSPAACRWCPFQICCPAFWQLVTPDWGDALGQGALRGVVRDAGVIHGGSALSLAVDVDRGTVARQHVALFPLEPSIHPAAVPAHAGDIVRVVGLWQRPDGSVAVTKRTIVAAESDIPAIGLNGRAVVPGSRP